MSHQRYPSVCGALTGQWDRSIASHVKRDMCRFHAALCSADIAHVATLATMFYLASALATTIYSCWGGAIHAVTTVLTDDASLAGGGLTLFDCAIFGMLGVGARVGESTGNSRNFTS